ncbi:MAG: hypothetical protein JWN56_2062 [Sphingobacteriales bacterium]|nr:hypothetical protein [Sphingobacteriales bacterium]
MKLKYIVVIAAFVLCACKKNKKIDTSTVIVDPPVVVNPATPNEPEIAKTAGFFLNDWTARTFSTPDSKDAAKPTAAVTTTVTVDVSKVITKVSKYVFGNNTNPYIGQMVTETSLINNLKTLSPNIIRFPGGNISSIYIWNKASGQRPADAPEKLLNAEGLSQDAGYWYGKNNDSWTLSVDNYYAMLQQTQSTGIITVNYAYARYSTSANPVAAAAHLAADWVRYDNGRTKYWEVGNESNGTWQAGHRIDLSLNKDAQPEIITGALYGKHFKVFADSMKKAAQEIGTTIYIGAQLLQEAPASWSPATDKTWNQGVFAEAGNAPDYNIIHSYYTPYNTNSNAADILNTGVKVTQDMIDYVKQSGTTGAINQRPVALTEWNIFATGSKQMVSNVAGMHASIVLGELIKNNYGMASRWDIANGYDNGDDHGMFSLGEAASGDSKWNPRPVFYHMYYFQKYFGDRMVTSTVQGNSDILSYASSFSSGEAGAVVINKGTSTQVVEIKIANFLPGTKYYYYTLTGGDDNGEFSRKVLINGNGPSGNAGGPSSYASIAANSALIAGGIKISVPSRSIVYLVAEKKK